jgi:NO-binding membrane sensor protein with MHYT domain
MRVLHVAIMVAVIGISISVGAQAQYNCAQMGPKNFTTGITPMHCSGMSPNDFYCIFVNGLSTGVECAGTIPNDACGHALSASFQQCETSINQVCYEMAYNQWNRCKPTN